MHEHAWRDLSASSDARNRHDAFPKMCQEVTSITMRYMGMIHLQHLLGELHLRRIKSTIP